MWRSTQLIETHPQASVQHVVSHIEALPLFEGCFSPGGRGRKGGEGRGDLWHLFEGSVYSRKYSNLNIWVGSIREYCYIRKWIYRMAYFSLAHASNNCNLEVIKGFARTRCPNHQQLATITSDNNVALTLQLLWVQHYWWHPLVEEHPLLRGRSASWVWTWKYS